jgi:hypothetical protein
MPVTAHSSDQYNLILMLPNTKSSSRMVCGSLSVEKEVEAESGICSDGDLRRVHTFSRLSSIYPWSWAAGYQNPQF